MTNPLRRADSSPERYTPTHGVRVSDLAFGMTCDRCSRQYGSSLGFRKLGRYRLACPACHVDAAAKRALKEAA